MQDHQEQLKSYIQQQLQAGVSPDEITGQLRASGWQDEPIHQAFKAVQQAIMPTEFAVQGNQPQASGQKRGSIKTGWLLFKQALKLLNGNRYLLRYLVMTAVWSLAIGVAFILSFMFLFGKHGLVDASNDTVRLAAYGLVFLDYLVSYFLVNLYAAALAANILDIFKGERRPYPEYMRLARSKSGAIFVFSLMSATIGMFLQFVVERIRFIGWLLAWLLGTAWSLGTMFVLPIIVTDPKPNAFRSVGQSIKFFKQTWGENIVAKVSVNAPLALIMFAAMFFFFLLAIPFSAFFGSVGIIIWFIVWVLVVFALSVAGSFANSVINTALYYFAAHKKVPPAFSADLLNSIFVQRKKRASKS